MSSPGGQCFACLASATQACSLGHTSLTTDILKAYLPQIGFLALTSLYLNTNDSMNMEAFGKFLAPVSAMNVLLLFIFLPVTE